MKNACGAPIPAPPTQKLWEGGESEREGGSREREREREPTTRANGSNARPGNRSRKRDGETKCRDHVLEIVLRGLSKSAGNSLHRKDGGPLTEGPKMFLGQKWKTLDPFPSAGTWKSIQLLPHPIDVALRGSVAALLAGIAVSFAML